MLKDIIKAALTIAAISTGVGALTGGIKAAGMTAKAFFFNQFTKFALYMGLSAITAKGANNTSGKNLGIKQAGLNSIAPRNIVYGKNRVGGTIVYRAVSGNSNTKLHNVIALAGHEINDLKKLYIDGGKGLVELDLSSDFTTATENGETVYRVTNTAFTNTDNPEAYTGGSLIKLTFEKGDQTTSNGYAVNQIGANWTTDHKLQGIAYVYINCIYDAEKFASYPNFSFEVEGKKVYDPVTTTTAYSTNPALIIRDYLMDSTYGFGAVSSEINDATTGAGFVKARSDCNDSVSITGGTESRYTLNGQFDSTEEPQQVLQHMLSACAGQLLYNNGKFSLFVGKERTASGTITDDKLLAPISITTKASGQDLANGVKATYVRPSDNYIAAEITPYQDSTYLTADTPSGEQSADYENYMDLSFPYTQSTFTAQRLARISLDYQRQDQTLSAIVPLEFMTHQVGDIINFTNDRLGYSGKDFEIVAMGFEFVGDNYLALRLNLKEYSTTVFDNITYVADPTLPSAPSAGDNTVGTPTGLTVTEFSKSTTAKEIYVKASWTNDDDDKIVATEVAFKKSTDSDFSSNYTSYPQTIFLFRAESSTTYNFKVRHISSTGVAGDYTGVENITTSADVGTFTDGTIAGITVATDKLYEGTGTFNNSNTGFYLDNTGQFSLKDKLSFDGTTLNISGNLTVENTISADKILLDGTALDTIFSYNGVTTDLSLGGSLTVSGDISNFNATAEFGTVTVGDVIQIASDLSPSTTTNALYNQSGTLYWNGSQVGVGAINSVTNMADNRVLTASGANSANGEANLTFDGSTLALTGSQTISSNLTVTGDLTVNGTTVTLNTATLDVEDKNITLNYGAGDTSASANGAGITIQDAVDASTDATILWNSGNDRFDFSHTVQTSGGFISSSSSTFNDDVTFIGAGSDMTWDNSADKLNFDDNTKATFGNSDDLQIYHDGNDSYVDDAGTGILFLRGNTAVKIQKYTGEAMIDANADGSVYLYNDNAPKLQTTSSGIDVTGTISSGDITSSGKVKGSNMEILGASGSSGFMYIFDSDNGTSNTDGFLLQKSGNNAFVYNRESSGSLSLGAGNTSNYLVIDSSGNIDLGSTQILDQSRNLTNIGTISSGKISAGGTLGASVFSGFNLGVIGGLATAESGNTNRAIGLQSDATGDAKLFAYDYGASAGIPIKIQPDNANVYICSGGGSVGIGTSSPDEKLHVHASDSGNSLAAFTNSTTGLTTEFVVGINSSEQALLYNENNTDMLFATNDTERMRITSAGNVGIGNTAPSEKLTVDGGGIVVGGGINRTSGASGLFLNYSSNVSTLESASWGSTYRDLEVHGAKFIVRTGTGSAVQRLTVDTSGNVGIGTGSPSYKLDVQGSALINGNLVVGAADSANRTLTIAGGATGNAEGGELRLATAADHDSTYDFYRLDVYQDDFRIGRAGTTDLTLNSSGNATFAGDISIPVAKSLYFGGGSHTYIREDIDDRLRFFVGGAEFMRFTEDTTNQLDIFQPLVSSESIRGASYKVGTTEVIDSSRNLTNIGTISSGAITSTGQLELQASTPSIHFLDTDDNSDGYIQANAGTLRFYADDANEVGSSIITFNIDGGEKLRIDNAGRLDASGVIDGVGGSNSAPSYIFEGDTDTGLYHPAVDTIAFATGGSERGRFLSTGLSVVGNAAISGNFNTSLGGYQVGGQTVIDSARALTNISSLNLNSRGAAVSIAKTFSLPNTAGNSGRYIKLGTISSFSNSGHTLVIRIHSNAGYNASDAQNQECLIRFKTSNNSSNQSGFYGDCQTYNYGARADTPTDVIVKQVSSTEFEFYGIFQNFTGNSSIYTVEHNSGVWTHAGTDTGTSAPSGTTLTATKRRMFITGDNNHNSSLDIGTGTIDSGALTVTADAGNEQITIKRSSNTNEQLILGFHSSDYGSIQAVEQGVSFRPLVLQPSGGNVGINTTNPVAPLVVSNGGAAGMEFHPELVTDTNRLTNYDRTASAYMNYRQDALTHQFYVSGFEKMRIGSNGSVGIATTSPSASYKLDVNGKIRSQQEMLINTGSLFVNQEGEGIHLLSPNGTEYKITVDNSGNLVATEQ